MDKNELIEMYKEEVEELTVLLKEEWTDLKNCLDANGVNTEEVLLVGYVEGEDEEEVGLLYTENGSLLKFIYTGEDITISEVTKKEIEEEFPQVGVLDEILSSDE